jgi:MFS family permease
VTGVLLYPLDDLTERLVAAFVGASIGTAGVWAIQIATAEWLAVLRVLKSSGEERRQGLQAWQNLARRRAAVSAGLIVVAGTALAWIFPEVRLRAVLVTLGLLLALGVPLALARLRRGRGPSRER